MQAAAAKPGAGGRRSPRRCARSAGRGGGTVRWRAVSACDAREQLERLEHDGEVRRGLGELAAADDPDALGERRAAAAEHPGAVHRRAPGSAGRARSARRARRGRPRRRRRARGARAACRRRRPRLSAWPVPGPAKRWATPSWISGSGCRGAPSASYERGSVAAKRGESERLIAGAATRVPSRSAERRLRPAEAPAPPAAAPRPPPTARARRVLAGRDGDGLARRRAARRPPRASAPASSSPGRDGGRPSARASGPARRGGGPAASPKLRSS